MEVLRKDMIEQRYAIERIRARVDGFKALLVRQEVKINTWIALHFMAFALIFIKRKLSC